MDGKTLAIIAVGGYLLLQSNKQKQAQALQLTAAQRAQLPQQCTFGQLGKLLSGLLAGQKGQQQKSGGSGSGSGGGAGSSAARGQGPCIPGTATCGKPVITVCACKDNALCLGLSCINHPKCLPVAPGNLNPGGCSAPGLANGDLSNIIGSLSDAPPPIFDPNGGNGGFSGAPPIPGLLPISFDTGGGDGQCFGCDV